METGEQYKKNIDASLSWLSTTETALGSINEIIQRARELTIYGASDTLSTDARIAIADEVEQLRGNLMQIANSDIEGRYIFAGFKTAEVPFDIDGVYHGDGGKMQWETAPGVTLEVNINGKDFEDDGVNIFFEALKFLEENLRPGGDTGKLSNEALEKMDKAVTRVLSLRSIAGSRMNRMEMASSRNFEEKINMTGLRSSLYDIDMAELLINYQ
ncbi:MAG: flagellar hook-associated protein FlgL, partial [Firmicutes bacterium HGW-Firmicutes-13]